VNNKCEYTGKLREIYGENGVITIKISGDKYSNLYNAIRYKNENVILTIEKAKEPEHFYECTGQDTHLKKVYLRRKVNENNKGI